MNACCSHRQIRDLKAGKSGKSDKKKKEKNAKSSKKSKKSKSFPTAAPILSTASPTASPTSSPTVSSKSSKKSSKSSKKSNKSSKKSSKSVAPPPTASPTDAPTVPIAETVLLNTIVCAPDCGDVDPAAPDVLESIRILLAPPGVDPSTLVVTLESASECETCGSGRRLHSERMLQDGTGERDIQYSITSVDPAFTAEAVTETVTENIEEVAAEIATAIQPGATIDPGTVTTEVVTPPPTPTPIGTPSPAGRRLKTDSVLFASETNKILEARERHEYDDDFKILSQLNFETRMHRGYEVLSEIMYDEDPSDTKHHPRHESDRAIVAYSAPTSMDLSDPKQSMYHTNFLYFLDNAIDCTKHSTLIVTTEEVAEVYRPRIEELNQELCGNSLYSIRLTLRVDKCYDMESMATFLRETDTNQYDYFLYVNCGMIGPKTKGDDDKHWTETFTSRLSDKVKLSGVSINMSFYPHVQSMVLATDRVGIEIIKNSGAVYDCGVMNNVAMTENERWNIIDRYELGMSRAIIEAGYTITSLTGALGKSISLDRNDIDDIKAVARDNTMNNRQKKKEEGSHWDSDEMNYLLPLGDDIWNPATIRTMRNADGELPSWSDFVFFKASRGILLPEIYAEAGYDDPTIDVIEGYGDYALPDLAANNATRDICEEARFNFREASKLGVIITGYEHTGTTMLAQLIKSAPGLFGGFECGIGVIDDVPQFYEWLTWSPENDLWGLTDESRDIVVNSRCMAEKYYHLHRYSPLFHYGNHYDDFIVDKTPRYLHHLVEIMKETPGIPVIVTNRDQEHLRMSYRKRGYSDHFIDTQMKIAGEQIDLATKRYPGRIKIVDTTQWLTKPNEIMEDVFDFLGLQWNPEYLNMNALNLKRLPGSVVSKPFKTEQAVSSE